MDLDTRIRDSFARQGLMDTLGATVLEVAQGMVTLRAPIRPGSSQQKGYAHGALAFAIGDSAAGYSAVSMLGAEYDVVTSEMGIHYLAPAQGEALIARGTVLKPGRRLIVTQADVFALADGLETHVARLSGTMVPVPA